MGETRRPRTADGFIALETIALIIIVVLVAVVTTAIVFVPGSPFDTQIVEKHTISSDITDDITHQRDEIRYVSEDSPFVQPIETDIEPGNPPSNPFNQRVFEDLQVQFANFETKPVSESRFAGKVLEISRENGLYMKLENRLQNNYGLPVDYYFEPASLDTITVTYGSLESIRVGDEIHIDETNDYALPYQESIKSVKISKIAQG